MRPYIINEDNGLLLFGANPLSKPMMASQSHPKEQTSMKIFF